MPSPINNLNYQSLLYLVNKMTNGGGYYNFKIQDACSELNLPEEIIYPMLQEAISFGILSQIDSDGIIEYRMTQIQIIKAQTMLIEWILERLFLANI